MRIESNHPCQARKPGNAFSQIDEFFLSVGDNFVPSLTYNFLNPEDDRSDIVPHLSWSENVMGNRSAEV